MKRLRITFLVSGLIFTTVLNAQYSALTLSKYKLPEIRLNKLDLNINLDQNTVNNSYKLTDVTESDSYMNSLTGLLNLGYSHFRNTEKFQADYDVTLNLQPSVSREKDNVYLTKNNNINSYFQITAVNRFFNSNKYFIEVDPNVYINSGISGRYHDYSASSFEKESSNQFATIASIPVSAGHGRIEPVEDARLAIYIIEELNKAGRISGLPSEAVVLEMAKIISKIKNKRFFDTRIRKIEELQVIDSFLLANNIISTHDISYFAVLNDQWDYAAGPVRESGFAVNIGIDNYVSMIKSHYDTENSGTDPVIARNSSRAYKIGGFFRIRYAKPVSLYWQNSLDLLTSIDREFNRSPQDLTSLVDNYETNIIDANLRYSWQFLPNSRTSLSMSLNAEIDHSTRNLYETPDEKTTLRAYRLTLSPLINLYYYISPQMRIQLNSSFSILESHSTNIFSNGNPDQKSDLSDYHHDISLSFTYSFF